jgi:hypothetical protein
MLSAAIGVRTASHSLTDLTGPRMFADRMMTMWTIAASSILIDRRLTIGRFRRPILAGEPIAAPFHWPAGRWFRRPVLRPEFSK